MTLFVGPLRFGSCRERMTPRVEDMRSLFPNQAPKPCRHQRVSVTLYHHQRRRTGGTDTICLQFTIGMFTTTAQFRMPSGRTTTTMNYLVIRLFVKGLLTCIIINDRFKHGENFALFPHTFYDIPMSLAILFKLQARAVSETSECDFWQDQI